MVVAAALHFSRRRWLLLAAAGISVYGAYRLYNHPSVSSKRLKLSKLAGALFTLADAVSSSAETVDLVASDLHRFLRSDSDELPLSLKQLSKITTSDEFLVSLSRISEALVAGISRGLESGTSRSKTGPGFADRALNKLFTPSGSGFASVVVGSFARNLVLAFYSGDPAAGASRSKSSPEWVQLICSKDCREIIADSVQRFVSTAVTVYLDKTMDINTYDEIFSGLTNPKHESKVKDLLVSVCNGAVETLVKTSHHVLTNSKSGASMSLEHHRRSSFDEKGKENGGWMRSVSTTLAVPSNRKFVLDLTGRVTFETMRSFVDIVLMKMYDGAKRSAGVVREETMKRGLELVRYVSAKSMVIYTICIALCMHVLTGTRALLPA